MKYTVFSVYKTILLSKIFRLKIEGCLIHRSKLRRVQKQVEGKARIKLFLQGFNPCFPLHLLILSKRKSGIKVLQDHFDPCFPLCLLSPMGLNKRGGKESKQSHGCIRDKGIKTIMQSWDSFDPFPTPFDKPRGA